MGWFLGPSTSVPTAYPIPIYLPPIPNTHTIQEMVRRAQPDHTTPGCAAAASPAPIPAAQGLSGLFILVPCEPRSLGMMHCHATHRYDCIAVGGSDTQQRPNCSNYVSPLKAIAPWPQHTSCVGCHTMHALPKACRQQPSQHTSCGATAWGTHTLSCHSKPAPDVQSDAVGCLLPPLLRGVDHEGVMLDRPRWSLQQASYLVRHCDHCSKQAQVAKQATHQGVSPTGQTCQFNICTGLSLWTRHLVAQGRRDQAALSPGQCAACGAMEVRWVRIIMP
jgi:hypothetical protein